MRVRLTALQREVYGRRALEHERDRGWLRGAAEAIGVTPRWLRELRRRARGGARTGPPGRPRVPAQRRETVATRVQAQLKVQGGQAGWRPILAALLEEEAELPEEARTRAWLVQEETARCKREHRAKVRQALEAARTGHEVLVRDAVWSTDAMHVGRLEDGKEVQAEVMTDRGSLKTVAIAAGRVRTSEENLALYRRAKLERGGPPLVRESDNGGAEVGTPWHDELDRDQVIVVRTRPHTPTDNPAGEHRNGELLAESGLGKGVVLDRASTAGAALEAARARLDRRRRGSKAWRTADELDRELPRADARVPRAEFYAAACAARRKATLGLTDVDAIRQAERRATYETLERFGLARARVGKMRIPTPRGPPLLRTREAG